MITLFTSTMYVDNLFRLGLEINRVACEHLMANACLLHEPSLTLKSSTCFKGSARVKMLISKLDRLRSFLNKLSSSLSFRLV